MTRSVASLASMSAAAITPLQASSSPAKQSTHLPLAYLRAFVTLLVIAHHAALAYYPLRPRPAASLITQPRWWQAFPVVDTVQSKGFLFTVLFNDVYFMSLMFLLSGLFTWKSLRHRGVPGFLRGRLLRLGLPFVVFSALAPVGYYTTYLQSETHDGFWHEWLGLGNWPGGPVWFLFVLLTFDFLATGIFSVFPRPVVACGHRLAGITNPFIFAGLLFLLTTAAYVPMALNVHPYEMWIWGPFYVQKVRAPLYLAYFLFGVVLGAGGLEKTLLQRGSRLGNQWPLWVPAAPASFGMMMSFSYLSHRHWAPTEWSVAIAFALALSCTVSSLACLSFFLHFVRKERVILESVVACAYGIYLTHYFFVAWSQYALLGVHLSGLIKGVIVLIFATLISWGLTILLRRLPGVARII